MTTDLSSAWATALEARNPSALAPLLADDVVLHSPLTDAFVFRGRAPVAAVFAAAFDLIDDIRVHACLRGDGTAVVAFAGRVAGLPMEETHLLRVADGHVAEVTLMGRPLPALLHVMSRIPALLAARGVMPATAGPAAKGIRPVAALLRGVDRHLLPRLPPR